MRQMTIGKYTRITRPAAKKLYLAGKDVYITASNMSPESLYSGACQMKSGTNVKDFEASENEFYYYNCNSETGKRINYWRTDK